MKRRKRGKRFISLGLRIGKTKAFEDLISKAMADAVVKSTAKMFRDTVESMLDGKQSFEGAYVHLDKEESFEGAYSQAGMYKMYTSDEAFDGIRVDEKYHAQWGEKRDVIEGEFTVIEEKEVKLLEKDK